MNTTELTLPQKPERHFIDQNLVLTDWSSIEKYYDSLIERDITSFEEFGEWLSDKNELDSMVGEDMRWRYIKTSVDTTDAEAKNALEFFYTEIQPKLTVVQNKLNKKLNDLPYKSKLSSMYDNFLKGIEMDIAQFREENIPISQELSLKINEYDEVTAAWNIEHNGEKITFQQARNLLKENDRNLRETTYRKICEARLQDADKLDDCMSEFVALRHKLAVNAGYKNFRDYKHDSMHRFDYSPQDCEQFNESVASVFPKYNEQIELERKQKLGVNTLRPWDMSVDTDGKPPLTPFEGTQDFVQKSIICLDKVDPYFAECLSIIDEMNYLDLDSRQGKAPGGYNMGMPEMGVPFIFMNHVNSSDDVKTMVHEAGHAVHSFLSHKLKYEFLRDYPSEVAELASMSMEFFTMKHWDVFYEDEEDLRRAKKLQLLRSIGIFARIAQGDAFQHWMYLNPNHSIEDRRNQWAALDKKFGTDVVNYAGFEKPLRTGYHQILHFFHVPFYYIEYAFSQLGAIAMWRNYEENPSKTIRQYKDALSLGYTASVSEIYKTAGIQFDFSKSYIEELAKFVFDELKKLD